MGDTSGNMVSEIEKKHDKVKHLENKIGLPESKFIEGMTEFRLNRKSSKRKVARIVHRPKFLFVNHVATSKFSPIEWIYIKKTTEIKS